MSKVDYTPIAKITRPKVPGVLLRARLFAKLDEGREKPVIWMSAPGGSGKTTLVASYIDSRKLPCLWYTVDAQDVDPATFFYYMGLAQQDKVPDKNKSLPLLTPEYVAALKTFTRRYFTKLFTSLPVPHTIVFDNYQDVSLYAPLHEILAEGLSLIPSGTTVIVLSRNEPPPLLSVHDSAERFAFMGWNDVRFSFFEAREFAEKQAAKALVNTETLTRLLLKTDGWIAGLILALRGLKDSNIDYEVLDSLSFDEVFTYFADEIFKKSEHETRGFLLKTAFMPGITASMAEQLTGMKSSDRFLSRLARNNFFTEKHSSANPVYQYHPLFREFLLARAIKTFSTDEVGKIRRKAAALLDEAGRTEDAAGLVIEAADWDALADLIVKTAPALTSEGRYKTLGEWLGRIPDEFLNKKPWLLYWKGAYLLPANPAEARKSFEAAYQLFKDEDNKSGLFLTWSYIVDTFMYEWRDFHPLDHWISELELLVHCYKGFDSKQVEDLVTCRMFCALMFRQPHHPDLHRWKEKAELVMNNSPDKAQSLFIGYNLIIYNLWIGRVDVAGLIVDLLPLRFAFKSKHSLPYLMWLRAEALYYIYSASYEKAMETITTGLTIAEEAGIHLLDLIFFGQGIYCVVSTGDVKSAEVFLSKLEASRNAVSCYEYIYYHHQASLVASHKGDFQLAIAHGEECLRLSKAAGFPFMQGIQSYAIATFLIKAGKYDDVYGHIAEIRKIGKAARSAMLELAALFLEAFLAMELQDNGKFIHYARKAFALSRGTGIRTTLYQANTHLICIKALEEGVDVDYVQELIRLHHIVPDKNHFHSENWPWQLKVRTLGSFELIKNDEPVTVTSKVKKPLELLKALIAFGGESVAEERLIDALWPDADGDLAHKSFDTTLHRLRKLIGNDKALQFQTGSLSLDPRYCWLDTKALERYCKEIEWALNGGGKQEDEQAMAHLFEKASALYRGEFLAADTEQHWAASMREHMRDRYIKIIGTAGKYWARREQWDKATAWFQRGIEADNLTEEFYQALMICYQKQGQTAQVIKTYQRCCSALSADLDVGPSPKTKETYHAIIQDPPEEEKVDATRKHQRRRH